MAAVLAESRAPRDRRVLGMGGPEEAEAPWFEDPAGAFCGYELPVRVSTTNVSPVAGSFQSISEASSASPTIRPSSS